MVTPYYSTFREIVRKVKENFLVLYKYISRFINMLLHMHTNIRIHFLNV